ncbi:UDP-N-acetylglucosamine transferase subunit ALG14 [Amylibacter sp.]|jgi:beta-1,4-N-acetylglucosaminyltransferase|nr:UDP-N-acetylglucosamine transferase subunit ALG14 [Amylibacter sp.]MDC1376434.1 UDP-N-acetylglucosamine transferase subunit ALG14 [Amylibacter sp.]
MTIKILGVAAPGGHLSVLEEIASKLEYEMQIVVSKSENVANEKYYTITEFNRNYKLIYAIIDSWRILKIEKPEFIISTGAGVAVPFFIIGKLIYRSKLIFIESASRVNSLSLTGKLVYFFVDKLYVRDERLAKKYKRAFKND